MNEAMTELNCICPVLSERLGKYFQDDFIYIFSSHPDVT